MDREPPQPPPGRPAPGASGSEGPGWPLCGVTPDWADEAEWERMCAGLRDETELPDLDEEFFSDPDHGAPGQWAELPPEAAAARAQAAAQEAAVRARLIAAGLEGDAHRRGAPPRPGIPVGPAAGFGQGQPLDALAPGTALSGLADEASGEDRAFTDVTDDELMGLIGARQRLAARQQWELLTGVAEFLRRRPDPGSAPPARGGMPAVWDEHAGADLALQLHLTPGAAEGLLSLAHDLAVKLPRTAAALRDGIIDLDKARTIAWYCFPLTPAEARAAEAILLGLEGVEEMTWGMIRDRIARAVIEVDPDAARQRRERAAKDKRVEIVTEQSGNCQLAGRELPPAAVLAASENLTARARQLRAAGVPGGMDELRALAYLEALGALDPLGYAADGVPGGAGPGGGTGGTGGGHRDDDPGGTGENGTDGGPGSGGTGGRGPRGPRPGGAGTPGGGAAAAGQVPAGFAARVNLTIPLATLLGLAERPGMLSRTGAADPALARDLAAAAARSPRSTWCVTVTGPDHRPVAHGCGRPPPHRDKRGTTARDGPVYTPGDDHDPPGTGTIRLHIAALTAAAGPAPPAPPARRAWCSRWRTWPDPAITSTRRRAMIRGSGCGT